VSNPYAGIDDLTRRVLARASALADASRHREITGLHVLYGATAEIPALDRALPGTCLLRVLGHGDRPRREKKIGLSAAVEQALPGDGLTGLLAALLETDPQMRSAITLCSPAAAATDQFTAVLPGAVASWQPPESAVAYTSEPRVQLRRRAAGRREGNSRG
jgi:hypothetical protein